MLKLNDDTAAEQLLDEIIRQGCSCDIMNGHRCDIHIYINRLRRLLQEKEVM